MKAKVDYKLFIDTVNQMKTLGSNIRTARKRRKMTLQEVAERLGISYQVVCKIEKGEPSVSMGAYMLALWLFDLSAQAVDATRPDADLTGKRLDLARLPERVRTKKASGQYDF